MSLYIPVRWIVSSGDPSRLSLTVKSNPGSNIAVLLLNLSQSVSYYDKLKRYKTVLLSSDHTQQVAC